MKRLFLYFLTICFLPIHFVYSVPPSEEEFDDEEEAYDHRGGASADSRFNAIGASMVGWGLGLAGAITALVLIIPRSDSDSSSSSTSHTH